MFLISLHILQYSVFGSIMTIGGMIGAIPSGKIADFIGRKRVINIHILA
jgi:SP family facilitated glucose transporter-like MFS transporter 8